MKDERIEEDLVGINKRISIKESRCEAGALAAVKNFKLYDQLSDEIDELKKQRRDKETEGSFRRRRENLSGI